MTKSFSLIILSEVVLSLVLQIQDQPRLQKETQAKKKLPDAATTTKKEAQSTGVAEKPNVLNITVSSQPTSEERLAAALNLVRNIGRQTSIDVPLDKVKVMLQSARLLRGVSSDDSRYLVREAADLLLQHKKKEQNEDEQKKIAGIEAEVVALYSTIDPERAEKFISDAIEIASENTRKLHPSNAPLAAKMRAEKMAELASALIEAGVLSGVDILLDSVAETGRVANGFYVSFRTAASKPEMRDRISARIKQAFSGKIVAEPSELSGLALPVIYYTGKSNSYSTINAAILELEIDSLKHIETSIRFAREQGQPIPHTSDGLDYLCGMFASSLREQYSRWLPSRLEDVDLCLKSIQESVSFKIGESKEKEKAETFEEKLGKASAIASGSKREGELINLAYDVLNGRIKDGKFSRDQMVDKVLHALNTKESKAFVEDGKIVTDIKELIKEKNFSRAANDALRISRDDWRAQVLTGVASCLDKSLDKTDQEASSILYSNAVDVLNASKPGTAVLRTTLKIAERFYEKDLSEGQRLLNVAIRFANQTSFSEKGYRFPFDRNIFAGIGMIEMALGFEPERIQDALRGVEIGKMAQLDWLAMHEASNFIENRTLRAMFQLKMCEGVINQLPKDSKNGK